MKIVNNPETDIDITKHAVIDASAGTGKTYSILKIIKKIILTDNTNDIFSKIVAVTYTEKATSELREKIRVDLKDSLEKLKSNKESPEYIKINYCYENFQELTVTTIHGFCNKLLTDYSFENKISFENQLVKDNSLLNSLLNKQIKSEWLNLYKDNLGFFMEISGFSENPGKFIETVLNVAERYKPDFNNKLEPSPIFEENKLVSKINDFENYINNLIKFLNNEKEDLDNHFLITAYRELKGEIHTATINARIKNIIDPLIDFSNNYSGNEDLKKLFIQYYKKITDWDDLKQRKSFLLLSEDKHKNEIEIKNNLLNEFIIQLENIRNSYEELSFILMSNTIEKLLIDLKNHKIENNLISYDDMLVFLNESLNNNFFLSQIQQKFKYALFDEFQDTDKIQYEIFKKIFIENKSNKMFIIGDPKQSIYGFRNTDIYSYLYAKNELINKYKAELYSLSTNFRSTEKIVDDFNVFFRNWFTDELEYNDVKSSKKIYDIVFNNEKRDKHGISIIDISDESDNYFFTLGKIISAEIKAILSNKIIIDKNKHELNENDIAILVRNRKEADIIYKILSENNIRSSFYKRSGLYQSDEALTIKYILAAILNSNNDSFLKKAILTEIFSININEIFNYEIKNRKLLFLFSSWINMSEKRSWTKLFHSILYDTGFIFRISNEKKSGYERKIINYKHIFEKLEKIALKNKFDIFQLYTYLNNLISNSIDEELEEDYWRIDTESNKVQIITMHASKGLEFPVVFLYTKFSKKRQNDFYYFHKENKIFFDLLKKNENKLLHDTEAANEDKRLFYVAATRAVYKLYLPLLPEDKKQETLIPKINERLIAIFDKNTFLNKYDYINNKDFITNELKQESEIYNEKELFPIINFDEIKKRRITLFSYSKLYRNIHLSIADEIYNNNYETENKDTDELIHRETDDMILPSSNIIGTMFHEILEKIDYKNFDPKNSNDQDLIKKSFNFYFPPNIKNASDEKLKFYFEEINKILYNTFNTIIGHDKFKLSDINANNRLNEVEFFLSVPDKNNKTSIYLNGFIDLVFMYKSKFYLIDWKSNYLKNGYEGDAFYSEVKNHYELQYKIYFIAFLEWIKKYSPDFDYQRNFGGIIYLYLRGIDMTDNQKGKFYFLPDENEKEKIKNEINSLIMEHI